MVWPRFWFDTDSHAHSIHHPPHTTQGQRHHPAAPPRLPGARSALLDDRGAPHIQVRRTQKSASAQPSHARRECTKPVSISCLILGHGDPQSCFQQGSCTLPTLLTTPRAHSAASSSPSPACASPPTCAPSTGSTSAAPAAVSSQTSWCCRPKARQSATRCPR